jgi:WD40 repeat protein
VLFEMLAGRTPYEDPAVMGVILKILQTPLPPILQFNPEIPPEVVMIVEKALEKEPEKRFPDADSMAQVIQNRIAAIEGRPSGDSPPFALAPSSLRPDDDKKRRGQVVQTATKVQRLADTPISLHQVRKSMIALSVVAVALIGGKFLWPDRDPRPASSSAVPAPDPKVAKDPVRRIRADNGGFKDIVYFHDGQRVITTCGDGSIIVWNLENGREMGRLVGHRGWVYGVSVSADGTRALSGGFDYTVRYWDLNEFRELRSHVQHAAIVRSVVLSPDGSTAFSAGFDGTIVIWHPLEEIPLRTLKGHKEAVEALDLSPDGKLLVSASSDHTIRIWDLQSGQSNRTITGHAGPVQAVRFSPAGDRILSGGIDATVRYWNAGTGAQIGAATNFHSAIQCLAIDPLGEYALVGCADPILRLLRLEDMRLIADLPGHRDAIWGVQWSPDGLAAASCGPDSYIQVWDFTP